MRQDSAPTALRLGPVGLRPRSASGTSDAIDAASFVLCERAVVAEGRRHAEARVAPVPLSADRGERRLALPLLTHAGPSAMAWSPTRAAGPEDVATPFAGRRTAPLANVGWVSVIEAFATAAATYAAQGADTVVINAERDSLLGAALSPRYAPTWSDTRRHQVLTEVIEAVIANVREVGLLLVVEECAPAGLDPAAGLAAARAAADAGVSFLISDAGSAWFRLRGADTSVLQSLASAAWLPAHVRLPVFAQVPAPAVAKAGLANVLARAKATGVEGVVVAETERAG
jgi:2,4-dienoyl-CoA reductase-like NADH-dependent reductase (Old Yellow Enzyme family)